jgi:hypothetical protein
VDGRDKPGGQAPPLAKTWNLFSTNRELPDFREEAQRERAYLLVTFDNSTAPEQSDCAVLDSIKPLPFGGAAVIHLTRLFVSLFSRTPRAGRQQANRHGRLHLETLEDRCVPSSSPLTLASNHELMHGSTVVLKNVELYEWSSSTNVGFALQQGGQLQDYTAAAPTMVHAVIGTFVESFGVTGNGTIYDLITGGQLQVSSDSGNSWSVINTNTESFTVTSTGTLYDLLVGGQLQVMAAGGAWTTLDTNTQSFLVTSGGTVYNLLVGGVLEANTAAGGSCNILDNETQAFAVTSNGDLFDLDNGGGLRLLPPGGSWELLDSNTQTFAATPGGTIYNLLTNGTLERSTNTGITWTVQESTAQSFSITVNGALYVLNTGGQLRLQPYPGAAWQTLDSATESFGLDADGTLYDLDTNQLLRNLPTPGGAWNTYDNVAEAFAVTSNGTLYDLDAGGQFWVLPLGGYWQWLGNYTQTFLVDANGTVYNQLVDGTLQCAQGPTGQWAWLDNVAVSVALSSNGTLYDLDAGGGLWYLDPQGHWQWLDNVCQSFAVTANGTLFDLDVGGGLWDLALGGSWQWLSNTTETYALDPNGTLFNLLSSGVLERSTNTGASWTTLDSATQAFNVTANGTIDSLCVGGLPRASSNAGNTWVNWFTSAMPDSTLSALAQFDYTRDGAITRADFIGLFAEAEAENNAVITWAELTSLQALVSTTAVAMPGYVRNLASKVVEGNPANWNFQGQFLGQLGPGSSGAQMNSLVEKWFYGSDLPQTDIDPTTGAPIAYVLAGGTLFSSSGVPSDNDVAQGDTADCYFMASLGQVALQAPTAIENMFIDNGDGTYTVRFFNNGVPDYVTVNRGLPAASDGSFAYANQYQYGQPAYVASSNNVLWVALIEKAYAQVAEEGWSRSYAACYSNSYDSLNYGNLEISFAQITGATAWADYAQSDPASEAAVLAALAENQLVTMYTFGTFAAGAQTPLIAGHCYMIQSYDPTTGLFTFVNPYDNYGARVVQLTWAEMAPYIGGFSDVTPPPGMNVSSIVATS